MTLPDNRTGTTERRRRLLPSQVLAHMAQSRIKTPAQRFAAGLQIDEASRQAGFVDGASGRPRDCGNHDPLSYALGYAGGAQFGRKKP